MCKSYAIIANILGPFPKGQKVCQFTAFEHTNTQHLYTDTTRPRTYHYQWAHKRALGPSYHGRFNKHGHYGGKEYTPRQIAFTKALRLKWALKLKPSNATNWCTCHNGSTEYGRLAPTQINETTLDGLIKDLKEILKVEGNQEKYLDALIEKGFYSGTQLAIMAGTLHIRTLFIFRGNRLEIPILYHSFKGTQEHLALVDSGAMENFMDQTTIKKLKLGTKKLKYPIPVRNINGTNNWAGHITDFIELVIKQGTKKVSAKFYIMNLGSDQAILGYPWLRDFNPNIDWPTRKLNGPQVEVETPFYSQFPTMCHIIEKHTKGTIPTLDHPSDDIKIRAAKTQTPEPPHETLSKDPEAPPEASSTDQPLAKDLSQLPKPYKEFAPIFAKPVAGQLPPYRPWDLKVQLISNAPLSLTCCPYPLSRPEQIF